MAEYAALRVNKLSMEVNVWLNSKAYSGFGVRETGSGGDNEHWHYLVTLPVGTKLSAFRTAFLRHFPSLKGNGDYSLSACRDVDKYARYCAKGEAEGVAAEVVWRYGLIWTDEKLEELHEAYWGENRRLKKRKQGSMVDRVLDICKERRIAWDAREKISEIYIREVTASAKPLSMFSLRACVNSVQVLLCPTDEALRAFALSGNQF